MNWLDAIRHGIAVAAHTPAPDAFASTVRRRAPLPTHARARLSSDTPASTINRLAGIITPLAPATHWQASDLTRLTERGHTNPAELLKLMADISPEISRGLWDFLRLMNPGWTATVLRPGGAPAPRAAQDALSQFLKVLDERHGSIDIVIGRILMGGWLRGAFAAELVLDAAGRTPLDLATPDPALLQFRQVADTDMGMRWQLGQQQGTAWVALDVPTVRYLPVDPFPGSPYGRSLAHPAIFPALFLIGMLHDLRRVVRQQGYPRMDIEVAIDQLLKTMPDEYRDDPDAMQTWIGSAIAQVQAFYADLEPDDAYVHLDAVKVNGATGTLGAGTGSIQAADGLIRSLERMVTRALKSMPLMMGIAENVSETLANRQWEIHAAGIKALQHLAERLLESLLTLALQAQGIQGRVQFRFAELRAAEMLRDAQTLALNLQNAGTAYDRGYISQDEAAHLALGREKADQPAPRPSGSPAQTADPTTTEADPGSNR